VHGWRSRGELSASLVAAWPFWLAALLPVLAGEAWLASIYGRFHPIEVILRADEISRGDVRARLLGVLARLSLGLTPFILLTWGLRRSLVTGTLLGAGVMALAWQPAALDWPTALRLLPFVMLGSSVVVAAATVSRAPAAARGPGQPCDGLLLALWAGIWLLGVVLVHNFAAPRYLLPGLVPLALLLARAVDARPENRHLLWSGVLVSAVVSLSLTVAEHRYFQASAQLGEQIARTWQSPGVFPGEWSFRYAMTQKGWTMLRPDSPSGVLVVAPLNASPGELPEIKEHVADYAIGDAGLRVMCVRCRVGLYGDTLGVLPLGWSSGALEEATAWRLK